MLRGTVLFVAVPFLLLALCTKVTARVDTARITVDTAHPGPQISPSLFGIFFEEINHAGDGGIYAEMVRNRSFEDADTPDGWSLVKDGEADGSIALDTERPLNAAHLRSLRIEVAKSGPGRVGAGNRGYWGMGVKRGAAYTLSLFARVSSGYSGKLTVTLETAQGQPLASATLSGASADWKRLTTTLRANADEADARLVIRPTEVGTVWLQMLSLFPRKTWNDRPNGLRPDLAEMLARLKPSFVRFPGGCYCEGNVIRNAFRWKPSVGDISQRPGHLNDVWGYRSTDGLGYHEYLQMCEDLGADALFVINCGMAHREVVPMDKMDEFVQDALDAVEYANGPVTTKWGALRAKNGHPAPFSLKYMEIGNENGGPAYEERYALFYDALKAKYPDLKLVANVPVRSRPMDILDEHYYSNPAFFISQSHRYDAYDRGGPAIYVGEYAVTQDCGKGNLRAALGEAAFMMGMETNGDVVRMCSYAPLFVNVNNWAWNPNMICYDSTRSYGTPSYYVQKLFSNSRFDAPYPVSLEVSSRAAAPTGGIGVGTWSTQAEFKDVRVVSGGKTLYASDYGSGAEEWRVVHGAWAAQAGVYTQTSRDVDVRSCLYRSDWSDYTYSLKARKIAGAEGFLILFHARDDDNWLWWNIGGWGNTRHAIEKSTSGGKGELGPSVDGSVATGRWYDIEIELRGDRIRCYLDGKLIHDVRDAVASPMTARAGRVDKTGEIVLKVVNNGETAQETEVTLTGLAAGRRQAECIVLTADNSSAENSLDDPKRVVPVASKVTVTAPTFRRAFPPHSLTILRIRGT